ncbi:MAG: right-handed parallel beta-helix repeat-containing protein [Verrucomicrobiota bacterium]|nr:right-handed parallel beta-helix repeat-containing protein [Verrucomicrobiota bacterium]
MFHPAFRVRLFLLRLLWVPAGIQAADWYVAPSGTPSGPGTLAQPYDLATALSGQVGQPGDTFWLTGGNYTFGHVDTKIQGAPGQAITFESAPGEWARVDGSLTFWDSAGYVTLRDLELYSSDTNRVSAETNAYFNPTDIHPLTGIASYVPNMRFINLVVHDETREGIYISQQAPSNLVYGCLIYNNGWSSPDNAEGHGIYVQGSNGGRVIENNIVFNNAGADLHVYDNGTNNFDRYLSGITLDGNVAFNGGAIQDVRQYRDWIVGVDAPAIRADDIIFDNNMGYFPPTPGEDDRAQIGREGINGSVAILNNYLPEGLEMNNWTIAAVAGNVLGTQTASEALSLNQQAPLAAAWNGNTYVVPTNGDTMVKVNSLALGLSGWQNDTGYDLNSIYRTGNFSGTNVFVRPNYYEPGRANIIVYNWDNQSNVAVDVSSVLTLGTPFQVRNAEDFFAPPVLSGIYDGTPLELPMTGLTVAVPNGPMITPAPTGPTFNVFVLLPSQVSLQATVASGQVQLSWPANFGNWVLQFTPSLSPSAWTDVTAAPTVVGEQNLLAVPLSGSSGFYRLKAVP